MVAKREDEKSASCSSSVSQNPRRELLESDGGEAALVKPTVSANINVEDIQPLTDHHHPHPHHHDNIVTSKEEATGSGGAISVVPPPATTSNRTSPPIVEEGSSETKDHDDDTIVKTSSDPAEIGATAAAPHSVVVNQETSVASTIPSSSIINPTDIE